MTKFTKTLKKECNEFTVLLRSTPALITTIFICSLLAMNLLANKSISVPSDYLALDCGIIVSWFAFLAMDVLTKHFGPKAATELSALGLFVNLFFCLIFFIGSKIPGDWSQSYVEGSESVINGALDGTFGGTWYVVLGSAVAFAVSAAINNFLNYGVGKLFHKKPDGAAAFFVRAYVSTAISQFSDNLIFAFLVSRIFFGWSTVQCLMCSLTGMAVELLCEAVFSPIGYAVSRRWKKLNVGKPYLDLIEKNQEAVETESSKPTEEVQ